MNLPSSSFTGWGIHLFKASIYPGLESGSYFVERPYASLLVFPPHEQAFGSLGSSGHDNAKEKQNFEFIESKGGLAFLFHVYQDRPNDIQKKLYQRFGCPLICPWSDEIFFKYMHEDYSFRYGKIGEDFYDHQVDFVELEFTFGDGHPAQEGRALLVYKQKEQFLFIGAPWLLDRGQLRHSPSGKAISKIALIKGQNHRFGDNCTLVFQFFRGLNWLSGQGVLS